MTTTIAIHTRAMETVNKQIERVFKEHTRRLKGALGFQCEDLVVEVALQQPECAAQFVKPGAPGGVDFTSFQQEVFLAACNATFDIPKPEVEWSNGEVTFRDEAVVVDFEPIVALFAKYGYRTDGIQEQLAEWLVGRDLAA